MNPDFFNIGMRPSEWGISRMAERISQLQTRFNMVPTPVRPNNDFQQELESKISPTLRKGSESELLPMPEDLFEPGTFPGDSGPKETKFDPIISEAAKKYDLDEDLLRAVIKAESNYNAKAVSPKGAMGLMQLIPSTAKSLGVTDPFDPSQNVDGGAKYLRQMLDKFDGDVKLGLSAYNAGPKAVETYKGVPPYNETRQYIKRIMGMLSDG